MHMKLKGRYVGTAELTRDMVDTLHECFDIYADNEGVLALEIREGGIFLPPVAGDHRQFLGLARVPKDVRSARN